ncbi:MAG: CBS domain-containing protein [Chloroflexi bacterium]|nr:CBS domain-containing protein [Chloroflexota bacterium]
MLQVDCCMKKEVISVLATDIVADAANLFHTHHIGMLPVLDDAGCLVGILQLHDLLQLIMPAFVDLIDDIDYVGDFGAMENGKPAQEQLDQPVSGVMEPPTSVRLDSGLLRAFAYINKYKLLDLPVVNHDNQLVGLASRVDIGRALLASWWQNVPNHPSA